MIRRALASSSRHAARVGAPLLLLAIAVVPVVAGLARLVDLAQGPSTAADARFFANPWPVTVHIVTVIPYALLGALQFMPALRRQRWHRAAGVSLVPMGLVAATSGLWMTLRYPWPEGDGVALFFMRLIVGVAMTWSIVRGTTALVAGDFVTHGAWMLRAYALGMGAGTQVLTHLPWFVFVDATPPEGPRAVMMGLGWAVNAAIAEHVIRTPRTASAGAGHPTPVSGGLLHARSQS